MIKVEDVEALPSERTAADIARQFLGTPPEKVCRFVTGIGHWVFDVHGQSGERIVVRVGSRDQAADFTGALHWSNALRPMGVPLPAVFASGTWSGFPYLVLERLPGDDLGVVYESLTSAEKRRIAEDVNRVQSLVASLGHGPGYGYVRLPTGPYRNSWRAVIDDSIGRSRSRIELANVVSTRGTRLLEQYAANFDAYFASVRPIPFLDDMTTKNVLIHDGRLAGVVDTDWICFGDPLLTVALTETSLLSAGRDLEYVEHWCSLLALSQQQRAAIRFYVAMFCADFMSELGHHFNREQPLVDLELADRLSLLLETHLHDL